MRSEGVLALKPASMTFEEVAAIPQAAVIALQGIRDKGQVQPGQRVLINGAGGGAGSFAVQLAKLYGAEVTGVDNTGKLDFMRSLGADHLIDYTREDFTKNGKQYDLILDVVAHRSVFAYARALRPNGRYFEDRREAVRQAADRLRSGGLLFSTHLSRLGILGDLMRRMPGWIERGEEVRSLLGRGRRPDDLPRGGFRGYFARVSEIRPLHEALGIQTVVLAGVEPAISADDESYNKLQAPRRDLWLDLLLEVSSDETTVGASRHLLYVGRKGDGEATA